MKLRVTLSCVVLIAATCFADTGSPGQLFIGTYITGNSKIYDYDLATATLNQTMADGELDRPTGGVIGPDGNLYVSCVVKQTVLRFDPVTGNLMDVFADSSDGLVYPGGMALGPDSNFYVANSDNTVIILDGTTGNNLGTFIATPPANTEWNWMEFGPARGTSANGYDLYMSSHGNSSGRGVFRFNGTTGAYEERIIVPRPSCLLATDDYLYIGDSNGGATDPRLWRQPWAGGAVVAVVSGAQGDAMGLVHVKGMAFDTDGNLLVNSYTGDKVVRVDVSTGNGVGDFVASVDAPRFMTPLPASVPLPSTLVLIGSALGCWLAFGRRRRRLG